MAVSAKNLNFHIITFEKLVFISTVVVCETETERDTEQIFEK